MNFENKNWVHRVQLFHQHLVRWARIALSWSIPIADGNFCQENLCSPGSWNSCFTNHRCRIWAPQSLCKGQSQSWKCWAKRPWGDNRMIQKEFMSLQRIHVSAKSPSSSNELHTSVYLLWDPAREGALQNSKPALPKPGLLHLFTPKHSPEFCGMLSPSWEPFLLGLVIPARSGTPH